MNTHLGFTGPWYRIIPGRGCTGPCTRAKQRRSDHGAVKAPGMAQPAAPRWAPCSPALGWDKLGGLGSGFEALLQNQVSGGSSQHHP